MFAAEKHENGDQEWLGSFSLFKEKLHWLSGYKRDLVKGLEQNQCMNLNTLMMAR